MGGITRGAEEGGGPKNDDGFTRSAERCEVVRSVFSRIDIIGVEADKLGGGWTFVKVGRETFCGWDVEITVADGWKGCPEFAVFGAPPMFIALCKFLISISISTPNNLKIKNYI